MELAALTSTKLGSPTSSRTPSSSENVGSTPEQAPRPETVLESTMDAFAAPRSGTTPTDLLNLSGGATRAVMSTSCEKPSGSRSPRTEMPGILKLDMTKPRRSSGGSVDFRLPEKDYCQVEPPSPQPSVDRLSVSFRDRSDCSDTSVKVNIFDPGSPPVAVTQEMVTFPTQNASVDAEEEEDDDYSLSITQILKRRESTRRSSQRRRRRRPSSPYALNDDLRRGSSITTNSSGELPTQENPAHTAIVLEDEAPNQEQIFENIRLHKEVLSNVKRQPWSMRRKMKLVMQAKKYVKKHEGELQERLAQSRSTKDIMARFNIFMVKKLQYCKRELTNMAAQLIPWELRIKEIESHFGSAVASYFTFLRWMFWVNLVISVLLACFVMVPELLMGDRSPRPHRWQMTAEESSTSTFLMTLWDFEGALKYSPIFYGYYTNKDRHDTGYRTPFAYFMVGLAVYVYSFVATLRRMAKNSRMSKLSEKDDECTFTWKLFTGWDYMIGNAETAHNRVASIVLGFKEALLEETEKKKDEKNWKIFGVRVLVNLFVLILLTLSAYIVFVVVRRSTEVDDATASWWRANEITVYPSIISLIFPIFFEVLGIFEGYHPRKSLRIQLARIMVLNLLNLYTLIFSLFWKINHMVIELKGLKPNSSVTIKPFTTESYPPKPNDCLNFECSSKIATVGTLLTTVIPLLTNPSMLPQTTLSSYSDISAQNNSVPNNVIFENNSSTFYYETMSSSTDYAVSNFTYDTTSTSDDPSVSKFDYDDEGEEITTNKQGTDQPYHTQLQVTADAENTETLYDFSTTTTTMMEAENLIMADGGFEKRVSTTDLPKPTVQSGTKTVDDEEKLKKKMSNLCWETMFGQELVKLTVMDLALTIISTLLVDFIRAVLVRLLNNFWCWDLEKTFPQYGDFKIAENILHLVNNQGIVWMGMFFSPGLPFINLVKLMIMMYLRSWAVLTCNVPHEVVFRASRSNNFYLALLLTMLFLCVLPVGFVIVWIEPSWHCGPFSTYSKIYHIFTDYLRRTLPPQMQQALDYIASPAIVIPLLMLLTLIIYYLISLTNSLREANSDLKIQLRHERTEERRKMFQFVDKKNRKGSGESDVFSKWKSILPDMSPVPELKSDGQTDISREGRMKSGVKKEILSRILKRTVSSGASEDEIGAANATSTENRKPLQSEEVAKKIKSGPIHDKPTSVPKREYDNEAHKRDPSTPPGGRSSIASDQIPVIKISKTESDECILDRSSSGVTARSLFKQAVKRTIDIYRKQRIKDSEKPAMESDKVFERNKSNETSVNNRFDEKDTCPIAQEEKIPPELNNDATITISQ